MAGPMGDTSKNNLGVWALVLGILSIVCCGPLAGIAAIIIGIQSKKAQEEGLANNGNLGNVGMILGWISIAFLVIYLVLYALGIATFNFSSNFGN
jgi:hypothetical protein